MCVCVCVCVCGVWVCVGGWVNGWVCALRVRVTWVPVCKSVCVCAFSPLFPGSTFLQWPRRPKPEGPAICLLVMPKLHSSSSALFLPRRFQSL